MNLFSRPPTLPSCRDYQLRALDVARTHVRNGVQSILLCMPTGTGKTRTAVEACTGHVRLGGVPMFVAPRRELVSQATATLLAAGLALESTVYVRTIQELSMPNAVIPPASMVVLDEARHYVADAWGKLRQALPEAVYLGLDATPERGDGRGLGGMFDVLVEAISVKDAIAGEFLVPCETIRPDQPLGPNELAQHPFDAYWDHARDSSAVVFCHSIPAARELAAKFYDRGIPAAAVWGDMKTNERDNALELFAAGKIRVLCNMHLLTEGWDAPITETVILARSFPTAGGLIQAGGRGLRPHPGKTRCLLIDLPGCTHTLGELDEPRTWHLEGRAARRASDDINAKFCPVCGAVVTTAACEQCGYAGDQMKKRKPRVLGLPIARFARQRQQTDEEKAKALAGYLAAARRKGHQRWWAFKCFEGVYGTKPSAKLKTMAMRLG